jgi:hypothetical protein
MPERSSIISLTGHNHITKDKVKVIGKTLIKYAQQDAEPQNKK